MLPISGAWSSLSRAIVLFGKWGMDRGCGHLGRARNDPGWVIRVPGWRKRDPVMYNDVLGSSEKAWRGTSLVEE